MKITFLFLTSILCFNCLAQTTTQTAIVEIPECYELANVILALTDVCQADDNLTRKNIPYYDEMLKHFESHKKHPIVLKANKFLLKRKWFYYGNFRQSGLLYEFKGEKLSRKQIPGEFIRVPLIKSFLFKNNIKLIEDFARQSGFRTFFKEHSEYYEKLIEEEKSIVNIDKMWTWLEVQFPSRYQGYRVIMSPLVWGYHNTNKWKTNGYFETQMFISTAEKSRGLIQSDLLRKSGGERIVFTEIDHNYVNPITDKHKTEIKRAMGDIKKWNNESQGYRSAYLTFNEYMTWSVFCAYLNDNYSENDFTIANEKVEKFMTGFRGFLKFKEFNQFFLELYRNSGNQKIPDLYPACIKWMASMK